MAALRSGRWRVAGYLRAAGCGLVAGACLLAGLRAPAAESLAEREQKLIGVLESQAPPGEKALACKALAACGASKAVPALAPLLSDPDLASWARIALEAIPGPVAEDALSQALAKVQGRLLIGVINSLGVRRDPAPVPGLAAKLGDADAEVASAAAVALGCIGGEPAAQALEQALAQAPDPVRPAVAEGCIRCAEKFLAEGKTAKAAKLYDQVREGKVPKQKMLEATRGAILARKTAGLPLLLEQLRSPDKARFNLGLRTARELAGAVVTRALAREMWQARPERQGYLLLAQADRGESEAMATVLAAARRGDKSLRLVAIGVLDRYGNPASTSTLLEAAAGNDAEITAAALAALARMPGNALDSTLLARLPHSKGTMRQVLVELAARRQVKGALPEIARSTGDSDAGIRTAAVRAMGAMGEETAVTDLVRLLGKTEGQKERADIEAALLAISSRKGASCVEPLLPLERSSEGALRVAGLHALASAGGPQALGAITTALQDNDPAVQDEAARTLSTWPNTWPEDEHVAEPLLALARSSKNPTHQVLALRGYLQFLQGDKKLNHEEKIARLKESLPLMTRPEEKRQAIAVIHGISGVQALEILTNFAQDPAVAEDAFSALVEAASKDTAGRAKAEREKALNAALAQSKDEATRKKAQKALDGLK
ncbi:MAG: HEAT repeat domain-containing protein [Limisphaerales bacterium]